VPWKRTCQRLERWRRTRKSGARIPKSPWSATVHMAQAVGVAQTAKTLRLAYYSVMRPSVRRRNTGSSGTLPAERSKTHLCVGF
jgi:hypothetical protein